MCVCQLPLPYVKNTPEFRNKDNHKLSKLFISKLATKEHFDIASLHNQKVVNKKKLFDCSFTNKILPQFKVIFI